MSELTFEFDSATREPNDDRMRNILKGFFIVVLCFLCVFAGMVCDRASALRLQSRVDSIEARLQEIEERLPAQPAPGLMEGGVR